MKSVTLVLALFGGATAAKLHNAAPIDKVVKMLEDVKKQSKKDGKSEQESYDKFACWCEDTVAQKATDINQAKDDIEEHQTKIMKNKGDLGEHGAEISQLKKDIKKNIESQKEMTEVRDTEAKEYEQQREEAENAIGSLEAAIKVLEGAGTGKAFLDTYRDVQIMSIVSGVRVVLNNPEVTHTMTDIDLKVVQHFVSAPEDFVGGRAGSLSAAQIAQNPFGDYAPQSSQIQGILKGMYDTFVADLEQDNADEADKQQSFEELMVTKKEELATLEETLEKQTLDQATKTKEVAESREIIDKAKDTLEADEAMFADAKKTCMAKAAEWNERARLRSQELAGIEKAIFILTDPDAAETLKGAQESFFQVSAVRRDGNALAGRKAYAELKKLATELKSLKLARLAVSARTGGHFDKVITQIDKMIAEIRKEEKEDIEQRDRCQNDENKNTNEISDLDHKIARIDKLLTRLNNDKDKLDTKITTLEDSIKTTESDIGDLKDMRKEEYEAFKEALKDDQDAIPIIQEAIDALKQFYNENKIPLDLLQDPRPNTNFGGDYKGVSGGSGGAIGMMEMVKTDLEKEIKVASEEDAEAEEAYLKDRNNMQATLEAQTEAKDNAERELAELEEKITALEADKSDLDDDLDAQNDIKVALEKDCGWIKTHWDDRKEAREKEVQGLVDAKNYLAGMDSGADLLDA